MCAKVASTLSETLSKDQHGAISRRSVATALQPLAQILEGLWLTAKDATPEPRAVEFTARPASGIRNLRTICAAALWGTFRNGLRNPVLLTTWHPGSIADPLAQIFQKQCEQFPYASAEMDVAAALAKVQPKNDGSRK